LNGSPLKHSSVSLMLRAMAEGAEAAGGRADEFFSTDLHIRPCVACGPDATDGYCIFHDDMDRVYAALESAHAVVVGTPVYFDSVSGPMKLLFDRCNCITPLRTTPGGETFVPLWKRTRRGVFVAAHSSRHPYEMAERSVRGFMKWTGTKWEESLVYGHEDNRAGSVVERPELLKRAGEIGRRLIESDALTPG
jgi:multimeric flavodoxin WrbA